MLRRRVSCSGGDACRRRLFLLLVVGRRDWKCLSRGEWHDEATISEAFTRGEWQAPDLPRQRRHRVESTQHSARRCHHSSTIKSNLPLLIRVAPSPPLTLITHCFLLVDFARVPHK